MRIRLAAAVTAVLCAVGVLTAGTPAAQAATTPGNSLAPLPPPSS